MAEPKYTQLPPVIPYGFGFQPDTVQRSDIPIMLQKPESADLIKQAGDSNALAKPSTTQVAINARRSTGADKLSGRPKAVVAPANTQSAPTQQTTQQTAPATQPAQQPAQSPVNDNSQPPSTGGNGGNEQAAIPNTPDTTDSTAPVGTGRKNIHTVFQTITGKDPIPYGEKWRWYLQHGFTGMHGGLHQELMNQVNAETNAFGGTGVGGKNTYGQELRAQEMKRKTLMQQWDKLLWEWNHGYYSGDEMSVRKFNAVANKLRNAMVAEGISPDLIRDPSINAGGFAQGFQKDISNYRNKLDWLGGWMKTIEDNIAENPDWLNSNQATMEFDKMSEYVILNWAQSKGAIADAEKIRAQVEAMPEEDRQYYNGFMSSFFRGNAFIQMESLAQQGNQHAKELVSEVKRLINYDPKDARQVGGEVRGKGGDHIMQLIELIRADLAGNNLDLPIDLATAANAYKTSKEAFDDYVMKNANVDRKMVWDSASDQLNILKNSYDRLIQKGGLYQGWGYDGHIASKDLSAKLAEWQKNDRTDAVIRNARLGTGAMAGDVTDPTGKVVVRGGGAGTTGTDTKQKPKPKALVGKNAWFDSNDGEWHYMKGGQDTVYKGK